MQSNDQILAGQKSRALEQYALRRRSCPIHTLKIPGPTEDELQTILTAGARVPDHGKLCPWHFIVFEGYARKKAGEILAQVWKQENESAPQAKLDLEAERFMRAPVVIDVVSRVREGKSPVWEQILSAGAACQNLCMAANSLGYGTQWVTEWYAYSDAFRKKIGLDEYDHIAGFIYMGTTDRTPEERERPKMYEIVSHFEPGKPLNKGDDTHGQPDMGYPEHGFDFSMIEAKKVVATEAAKASVDRHGIPGEDTPSELQQEMYNQNLNK